MVYYIDNQNQKASISGLLVLMRYRNYQGFFLDANIACFVARRFLVFRERDFLYSLTPVLLFDICLFEVISVNLLSDHNR